MPTLQRDGLAGPRTGPASPSLAPAARPARPRRRRRVASAGERRRRALHRCGRPAARRPDRRGPGRPLGASARPGRPRRRRLAHDRLAAPRRHDDPRPHARRERRARRAAPRRRPPGRDRRGVRLGARGGRRRRLHVRRCRGYAAERPSLRTQPHRVGLVDRAAPGRAHQRGRRVRRRLGRRRGPLSCGRARAHRRLGVRPARPRPRRPRGRVGRPRDRRQRDRRPPAQCRRLGRWTPRTDRAPSSPG